MGNTTGSPFPVCAHDLCANRQAVRDEKEAQIKDAVVTIDSLSSISLETITVTADKRTALLQRTPSSVSIFNEKKITDLRLWSLKDLGSVVPNLFIVNTGTDLPYYSLRGMFANSMDQSVAIYVDGVMQYDVESTLRNLYDIERMEILRGPQGTLYGRNAMAGVINIITKRPNNITSGYIDLSLGNYGTQRYSAGVKAPLVKNKLFAGISGHFNKTNGFYTNKFDNKKFDRNHTLEGSLHLRYLPAANWTLDLGVKAQKTANEGAFPYLANDSIAMADGHLTNQNARGTYYRHLYNASVAARHQGKGFELTSITAMQYADKFVRNGYWDGDWTADDIYEIGYAESPGKNAGSTFTQEIRFNSANTHTGKFTWAAGAFYMHHAEEDIALSITGKDAGPVLNDPHAPYTLRSPAEFYNSGYALFGQSTCKLTPKLSITAGIRYDNEHKKMYVASIMEKEGAPDIYLTNRTRITGKYTAITPKFNAAYQLSEEAMIYTNYARGYRSGGLNKWTTDQDLYDYGPEFSNSYEAGYKASWLGRKLMTNLTLFYTEWQDMQVTAFAKTPREMVIRNTGDGRIKGVEVEITSLIGKGWRIDYNFGYNHGRYTSLAEPDASTCTEKDLSGNWLIMQPEFTSMLAAQYSARLKGGLRGTVRGEWSMAGRHYFNLDNSSMQKPYALFNAKAGLSYQKVELQIWARNIFNERYLTFMYPRRERFAMLGFPATFGASLSARF